MLTALVALAAGLGAVTRLLVDRGVTTASRRPWPLGTLAINVTGSFVFGLVLELGRHGRMDADLAVVLGAGFAGGYTTLSTFAWEAVDLVITQRRVGALGYVAASAGLGLAAAAAGLALGRAG